MSAQDLTQSYLDKLALMSIGICKHYQFNFNIACYLKSENTKWVLTHMPDALIYLLEISLVEICDNLSNII